MEEKILNKLQSTNLSSFADPHKYPRKKVLEKALWALLVIKKGMKYHGYLSPKDISEILLRVDISCKPLRITRALARAGSMVDKKGRGNQSSYKIMKDGEDYLKKLEAQGDLNVFYLTGAKPWSDRKMMSKQFIQTLKGEILIVDKFFGGETLDILSEFSNKQKIKFLTAKITNHGSKLKRDIKRFKAEHKHIEVRIYPKEYELHDRYLLTDQEICLLGHGLRDIGSKESFVLILRYPAGKEISQTLKDKFNERWGRASNFI